MRRVLAAVLLSALVFPGLGQLYNQDHRKGIILVLLANLLLGLLLLVGLILLSREYMTVFYPAPLTLEVLRPLLVDTVTHPLFLLPFCLLVGLWAFATVDAGRQAARGPKEE
jgi:O-antigen/teichoic acid export membrane protein